MSYETFTRLVRVESTLRRTLHTSPPAQHASLTAAIASIHDTLTHCATYDDFLTRMALSAELIG